MSSKYHFGLSGNNMAKISKSKIQVVYLYISTLVGMMLGVLISIVNTRFLDPVSYGDVHYVQNLISFFSGIFLFGYFVSGCRLLAISKTKEESDQMKGAMLSILGLTIFGMMVIMLVSGIIHQYIMNKPYYSLFYAVIPFCGGTLLLNYVNTSSQGDNSIGLIALARLLPSVLYLCAIYVIFNIFGASSMLALLLNTGITFVVLFILVLLNHPSFKNIQYNLKKLNEENKKYGFHVYLGSISNVSVQYLAGICLGLFAVDNSNVGFYSLALTATTPLMMLPNVIGTTYFKKFAVQSCIDKKILISTFLMSFFTLVFFIIFIHPVVDFLFTDDYGRVALYASFLALAATAHGLGDVFNRFIGAHGYGKWLRNGAFISGFVALLGYTGGVYFWGINGAIATRISFAFTYCIAMMFYYKKAQKEILDGKNT